MSQAEAAAAAQPLAAARWLTPVELTVLGAIWGASFLFMRVSAREFGALPLVEVRLVLGALILLPLLWRDRAQFKRAHILPLVFISAINSAIPFSLFAWAAQRAPAGIGAITNATAVMFTALVAFALYGEHITKRRAAGLLAGFVGVAVLASGKTAGGSVWSAALAGTFAAFLYGIGGNLVRRQLAGIPSGAVAAGTLLCASALLAPFAILSWPRTAIPLHSWASAILLGVLCTGIAYLIYFRLIYRVGATRASTVTYLIPLFGVIWAWIVLGEPLTLTMAIAGALILGGVALSQQRK
ncbi:MAG TPA: DMT family transporter [Steroidobacteraceae bacterium]|jgi:EamA-like transporter family.|nr:DMT family transporter [Steroidobacteraceae bacterium]